MGIRIRESVVYTGHPTSMPLFIVIIVANIIFF